MIGAHEFVSLIQLSAHIQFFILVKCRLSLSLKLCRSAKERKVRIWKDYVAPTANLDQKDRQFVAKVSVWKKVSDSEVSDITE